MKLPWKLIMKTLLIMAVTLGWCYYFLQTINLAATTWNDPVWTVKGAFLILLIVVATPLLVIGTAIVLLFWHEW